MNELMKVYIFEDEERPLRVVLRDGEPWFVAKDACTILGIANNRDAIEPLDDDEKGVALTDTLGGNQEMSIISESGLYTLILRSRAATTPGSIAHRFRKWVTAEVLPQLRKTGSYATDPAAAMFDDLYDLNTRVRVVEMATRLGGKAAGLAVWQQLGLPALPDAAAPPVRSGALQGLDFVRKFLAERTAEAPGGRVQARELSRAYAAWAAETGAPSMTERAIAMCLDALQVAKSRGNYNFYLGLRIKHISEFQADIERH